MKEFIDNLKILGNIERWGNSYNLYHENDAAHTFMVATIAHMLGSIENRRYGGNVDLGDVVLRALYHDLSESITGDIISGTKRKTGAMREAAKNVERLASEILLDNLPPDMRSDFSVYLLTPKDQSTQEGRIVEAADAISAYIKAKIEESLGNTTYKNILPVLRSDCLKHTSAVKSVEDIIAAIE